METKEEFKVKPFGRHRHARGSTGSNGYCSRRGNCLTKDKTGKPGRATISVIWPQKAFAYCELCAKEKGYFLPENTAQDKPKASGPTNTPELFQEYQTNGESLGGRPPGKVFLGFCLKTGSMSR
jgi:hypothetical protein